MDKTTSLPHRLSLFSLVMITTGSVDSVRNLPTVALFGSSLLFFSLLAAFFFLIPVALISAELASAWPEQGGVYVWVKRAYGEQCAFFAIWVQLLANIFWYPTILSFVAGSIGYLITPHLADKKVFLVVTILTAFWGTTFINLLGMRSSARFSNCCALAGLLLPMTMIISLGAIWVFSGHPLQISLITHSFFPDFSSPQMWVALTGVMMSFCGVEIATVHARDVHNPQQAFPRALAIATVIILVTLLCGSLSIALVLPVNQISLVAGIMQTFNAFITTYHMHWLLPLVAIMLVIGGLGGVSNWIIAPAKGLAVAAKDGNLPRAFQNENRFGAPQSLLILQGIIVSFLTLAFLLFPSVSAGYWLLGVLGAQIYMLMYLLMFATGIRLRYKCPERTRPFCIPFGNYGIYFVAGVGIIGSLLTFIIGFIPPNRIHFGSILRYEILLVIGLVIMSAPPVIIYRLQKKRHTQ